MDSLDSDGSIPSEAFDSKILPVVAFLALTFDNDLISF